jgi:hypothetical protein
MTLRFTFLGYEYASITLDIEQADPVEPVKAAERVVKGISKLWIKGMLGG